MSRMDELITNLCPKGVKSLRLIEICRIATGVKPNENVAHNTDAIPYVNAGIEPSGYLKSSNSPAGYITIPTRGQGGAGHVGYQNTEFWCGPLCYKINSITNSILSKYIFYYLKSIQRSIIALRKTGSIPAVNKSDLGNIIIPIPPLPVQEEIVRILDNFTKLEAELEARKKQYEYYRDELLIGEDNFRKVSLGLICDIFTGGEAPVNCKKGTIKDGTC
jgi:type I restriction enzyme, S subunit